MQNYSDLIISIMKVWWFMLVVGYVWFSVQWRRGKVKVKFTGEE